MTEPVFPDGTSEAKKGRDWRLDNFYSIIDSSGKQVPFALNDVQAALLDGLHDCNVILKARQLGFTTFIQLFMLDMCLFQPNIRAGTIAHTLQDAERIFQDKVKYPFEQLPEEWRASMPAVQDSARTMSLCQ